MYDIAEFNRMMKRNYRIVMGRVTDGGALLVGLLLVIDL